MGRKATKKKSRREMYGRNTQRQVKDSYDKSGPGGGGLLRDDIEGVQFWKVQDGENIIDIIPYFAGAFDPDIKNVKEGQDVYKVQVFQHRDVGPREQSIMCRAFTMGKKCPACEHRTQLQKEGGIEEDTIDKLKVSRYPRVFYNIISYMGNDEDKGIQIWHVSAYSMERFLGSLAKNPRMKGGGYEAFTDFSHPDQDIGKSISFTKQGKGLSTEYLGIKFVDRDYDISDELLESAHVLDECLFIPTYEQASEIYWGEEGEEDVKEKGVSRGHGRGVKTEGEIKDDDTVDEEVKESKERTRRNRTSESTTRRGSRTSESGTRRGSRTTETPKRKEPKRKTKEVEKEPDKDEPIECPVNGVFGTDVDELEHCEDGDGCEVWTECAREHDRLEEEKEK